jgi:gentisate 1,2-dioxygenase
MWLDGLDVPFVAEQDAIFFEEYNWNHSSEVQPVRRTAEDSINRWGRNLRPSYETFTGNYSPVLNYRWQDARGSLHALREDDGSPFDGIILE